MIRRHVLAALSVGIEAGDDAAARETLAHADWVLRGSAQRRLQRALIDAMLLTGEGYTGDDPEAMRHVQRVAALDVAGRNDIDVRDRRAVAETFRRLPTHAPSRAPIATSLAASAGLLALLAFVWVALSVRTPRRPGRPPMPAFTGAYLHGGAPSTDAELAAFLEQELTQLVIETDADRRGSVEGAARATRVRSLREAPVIVSRGPALASAWRALIDSLDRWVDVSVHGRGYKDAIRELGRRAQDVSEQFAALGLGYYLSADVMTTGSTARALLFSYRVEDVAFVRAGGEARRVLSLRRLDHLNVDLALLGRQGDELGDPVVLLDQVDEFAVERVMPVLAGEIYRLGDPDWRRSSRAGRLLASDAADGIDRELRAALGAAFFDPEQRTRKIKQLVAATVRRHEARHAIDYDRARPLRYPRPLQAILGTERSESSRRAELELAAYVSQIANDPYTPQFTLWNLASHAFGERWAGAEAFDAVIVIEGLARQLGALPGRPLVIAGRLDREALATLARPLAAQSSDKLRAAARALWVELYGEPLVPIVDVLAAQ